jgi:hypothetical protein
VAESDERGGGLAGVRDNQLKLMFGVSPRKERTACTSWIGHMELCHDRTDCPDIDGISVRRPASKNFRSSVPTETEMREAERGVSGHRVVMY